MKRILVIGNSPLPNENVKVRPAAGLRTFQFLSPMTRENSKLRLKVQLVTIAMPECYAEDPGKKEIKYSENFSHFSISKDDPGLFNEIQRICNEFCPEAVIAINTYPSYVAATLNFSAPLWTDLNGWVMAEAQAQAAKMNSNDFLPHYHEMEHSIIRRADKFSAVSEAQRYAIMGELAAAGRINKESFGYDFALSIPNGTEFFEGEKSSKKESGEKKGNNGTFRAESILEEKEYEKKLKTLPDGAFVAMWIGGYNTWVDEATLYKGLEGAMEKCRNLFFVSTGGEIKGLDENTYARFRKLVDESKYKDRFIFLGWVEQEDIPHIYKYGDVGLNVDRKCLETLTGARNRINEMMKFGLPVVTTLGSEVSYEVLKNNAGIAIGSGKHEELAAALTHLYLDKKDRHGYKLKEFGMNGAKFIEKYCNYGILMEPLMNWLENPRPAPDRGVSMDFGDGNMGFLVKFRAGMRYLKQNGLRKFLKKLAGKVRNKLKF